MTIEITSGWDNYNQLTLVRFDEAEYKAKAQTLGTIIISNGNLTAYSNDCSVLAKEDGSILVHLRGLTNAMPYVSFSTVYDTR